MSSLATCERRRHYKANNSFLNDGKKKKLLCKPMPEFPGWQSHYLTFVAEVIIHNVATKTDLETGEEKKKRAKGACTLCVQLC